MFGLIPNQVDSRVKKYCSILTGYNGVVLFAFIKLSLGIAEEKERENEMWISESGMQDKLMNVAFFKMFWKTDSKAQDYKRMPRIAGPIVEDSMRCV